jgi:adenine-specific DNA glycosylase
MELGATVCTPRNPACPECPIRSDCEAFRNGVVDAFPEKKKRAAVVIVEEERIALFDVKNQRVYLEKAAAGEWRSGLWDFPRELPKGMRSFQGRALGEIETKHVVTKHKITRRLVVHRASAGNAAARVSEASGAGRWISMNDPEVALGSAPVEGIRRILEEF